MSTAPCSRLRPLSTTNAKVTQHYGKSSTTAATTNTVVTPTSPTSPLTEATFTLKVTKSQAHIGDKKGGNSIGSSESSDPVETDYSDTDDEEVQQQSTAKKTQSVQRHNYEQQKTKSNDLTDDENDSDKENAQLAANDEQQNDDDDDDDDDEDSEDVSDDDVDVEEAVDSLLAKKKTNEIKTTNTTTNSPARSSGITSKGVRKYNFDDFQLIKTVGTGTFGRVCLCRDRLTQKYCAMKILAMTDVIRLKQVDHVKNERNILCEIKHPFVISLEWSTKDDCCLYMIFEYVCGGELFTYLRNAGRFSSQTANFYAAETISALEYLHSLHIVYRDLKPENLLINRDGHLKITDFGFAKKLRDRTWTLCGTPEYLAPEIIQLKGHNRAVDWWALGILIYEMIVGYPPFYDENPIVIYEKILSGKIEWPRQMDPIARDLIKKLLTNDRTKRLGNMKNGADDVKRHRWFKHLNWNDVYNLKLKPPIVPDVTFDGDTSNFDDYPEKDWKPARAVDQKDLQLFKDF